MLNLLPTLPTISNFITSTLLRLNPPTWPNMPVWNPTTSPTVINLELETDIYEYEANVYEYVMRRNILLTLIDSQDYFHD